MLARDNDLGDICQPLPLPSRGSLTRHHHGPYRCFNKHRIFRFHTEPVRYNNQRGVGRKPMTHPRLLVRLRHPHSPIPFSFQRAGPHHDTVRRQTL